MNILAIYDKSGPKYHRILMPVHLMPGIEVRVKYFTEEEDYKWCDIVFFNRNIPIEIQDVLKYRDQYGFKLVCDFDDHYVLDKDHYLHEHYERNDISNQLEYWIRVSDAVTVTHERLYNTLLPLNKNIHILPNAIAKTDQFLVRKIPHEYTRIFWAGSVTHKRDLELLRRPFQLLDKKNVELIMGGYTKDNPEWLKMGNIFTNEGRWRSMVIESLGVHEYYKMYSVCDIAVAPLVDNEFNRNKSNLKILEAANIASPIVVSHVHPYIGFPSDVVNYVDGHNTWYSHLTRLVREPSLREDQGKALQEYCDREYNFLTINKHRKEVFDYVACQSPVA